MNTCCYVCACFFAAQLDEMLRVREQMNAANKESGAKISVNDFVVKAAALALKKVGGALTRLWVWAWVESRRLMLVYVG